jgi:hypothetical protein
MLQTTKFKYASHQLTVEMNFAKIKKHHVSIFTTNLLAIVLASTFMKSYHANGASALPVFLIVLGSLAAFIIAAVFILKPSGRIKHIFPGRRMIALNMGIAVAVGLMFLAKTGLLGFCFVLLFAFFLFEAEHLIYEGMKR